MTRALFALAGFSLGVASSLLWRSWRVHVLDELRRIRRLLAAQRVADDHDGHRDEHDE